MEITFTQLPMVMASLLFAWLVTLSVVLVIWIHPK